MLWVRNVHLIRGDSHDRSIAGVQLLDLKIVAAVVVGLVELRDSWEERSWDLSQWVEEPSVDAYRGHVGDQGDRE